MVFLPAGSIAGGYLEKSGREVQYSINNVYMYYREPFDATSRPRVERSIRTWLAMSFVASFPGRHETLVRVTPGCSHPGP